MNHSLMEPHEFFVQQLVYLDENIKEFTNLYLSSTPVPERLKNFFSLYSLEVEDLIQEKQRKGSITFFPKVLIGTKVTVMYEEDHETEDYIICFPEYSDPDSGYISFVSPVGRQLLLKKLGETLSLKIPTGETVITIKDISYSGQLFVENRNIG
jgi:transcription elongation factor GreA